ncbi:MAG: DUF4276 family protein [Magnetococcus sp. YQC-3]
MHCEILVEGQSDLTTLSVLMPGIVGPYAQPHTWKIHQHRGAAQLLQTLPGKLRAYGKEMRSDEMVVVLVDLDDRADCRLFKQELVNLLETCQTRPVCLFRIAVEELEAWFLGDRAAVIAAYPHAQRAVLDAYIQDAQCGTWERLADAVHPGGMTTLGASGKRSPLVLHRKKMWARQIAPRMDVEKNLSPSFCCFRDGLRRYTTRSL